MFELLTSELLIMNDVRTMNSVFQISQELGKKTALHVYMTLPSYALLFTFAIFDVTLHVFAPRDLATVDSLIFYTQPSRAIIVYTSSS